MCKVLIFAGTTEGRNIAEYLERSHVPTHVCVATEYGESLLPHSEFLTVSHERLNQEEMKRLFIEKEPQCVIDATHPYAAVVTKNIQAAANEAQVPYIRLLRESGAGIKQESEDLVVYVEDIGQAVAYLEHTNGNILVTTGSKEIEVFTKLSKYQERVYARVLSLPNVVQKCADLGLEGKHLICMQGPFSKELNVAMLEQLDCSWLVTKESGTTGGFQEKCEAAAACNARLLVVGRPMQEEGLSLEECKGHLNQLLGISKVQEITLVGIGMGSRDTLTLEGKMACEKADLIIGAKRMVDAVAQKGQAICYEYLGEKIKVFLAENPQYEKIAIVLSGDVGFYSGAKKLLQLFGEETKVVCGISSLVYFMSQIHQSWEDAVITSAHGRTGYLLTQIRKSYKVFSILGTKDAVAKLAKQLLQYQLTEVTLYVGEQLSYPTQKIKVGKPKEFIEYEGDALSVICCINEDAQNRVVTHGITDEAFVRDKVPMTKEEVRSISLSKLRLQEDSICYDVGAGTGSVSIEMALQASKGWVYAIEKKPLAVELLDKNAKAFQVENLTIVEGLAPEALEELEAPTHAFIGGSSGNLKEIMELLLEKNRKIRMVINCIALETVAEAVNAVKALPVLDVDIVHVAIGKSKSVGNYHMMMGENPIYIISCSGGGEPS